MKYREKYQPGFLRKFSTSVLYNTCKGTFLTSRTAASFLICKNITCNIFWGRLQDIWQTTITGFKFFPCRFVFTWQPNYQATKTQCQNHTYKSSRKTESHLTVKTSLTSESLHLSVYAKAHKHIQLKHMCMCMHTPEPLSTCITQLSRYPYAQKAQSH